MLNRLKTILAGLFRADKKSCPANVVLPKETKVPKSPLDKPLEATVVNCHGLDPQGHPFHWRDDGICSYCGSIKPEEAVRLLRIKGTRYSGPVWDYSWPHKLYIRNKGENPYSLDFYPLHLKDASDEVLEEFSGLSKKYFGISWGRRDDGTVYYNAIPNTQLWGVVGDEFVSGCIRVAGAPCVCDQKEGS